ncbi:hypothetical protein [Phormidesmis sp. 146-33]
MFALVDKSLVDKSNDFAQVYPNTVLFWVEGFGKMTPVHPAGGSDQPA